MKFILKEKLRDNLEGGYMLERINSRQKQLFNTTEGSQYFSTLAQQLDGSELSSRSLSDWRALGKALCGICKKPNQTIRNPDSNRFDRAFCGEKLLEAVRSHNARSVRSLSRDPKIMSYIPSSRNNTFAAGNPYLEQALNAILVQPRFLPNQDEAIGQKEATVLALLENFKFNDVSDYLKHAQQACERFNVNLLRAILEKADLQFPNNDIAKQCFKDILERKYSSIKNMHRNSNEEDFLKLLRFFAKERKIILGQIKSVDEEIKILQGIVLYEMHAKALDEIFMVSHQ